MTKVVGEPCVGCQVQVTMRPPNSRSMKFAPTLLKAEPLKEFRWLGHLWRPGMFDGEHKLTIEKLEDNRVRFVNEEEFSGVLSSVILLMVGENPRRGFEAMNEALKRRAEEGMVA
jgi:hypothetical protein